MRYVLSPATIAWLRRPSDSSAALAQIAAELGAPQRGTSHRKRLAIPQTVTTAGGTARAGDTDMKLATAGLPAMTSANGYVVRLRIVMRFLTFDSCLELPPSSQSPISRHNTRKATP